jgi:RNA polymerase sporulation-specific sigma factor
MLVEQLLLRLNDKEKTLIQMRYFEDKPQREVAEHLGISQVQVSRMEKKILKNLRGFLHR